MLNRTNGAHLKIRPTVISLIFLGTATVSFITDKVPEFSSNNAFAQSTQTIAPQPKPKSELNMPVRAVDRVGTAFSGRRSVSIKSTDAGIIPRYPQTAGCINCGTVDFVNSIEQGNYIDLITGGIIGGIIRNKVIRRDQHYPSDTDMGGNSYPSHQYENNSANNINHYDVGVTMDDGTQAIITQPSAPQFHHGDRVRLIDGVVVPNQ